MRSAIHLLLLTSLLGCATTRIADPAHAPADAGRAQAADSASAHRAAAGFIAAFDSLQWEPFRAYLADDITMFFPFPQLPGRVDGRDSVGRRRFAVNGSGQVYATSPAATNAAFAETVPFGTSFTASGTTGWSPYKR